jgi:two-component system chemotaxis response regulator CheB
LANRDIVVIGASAGGIEALSVLVEGLPAGLPAAIFVLVHLSPDSPGYLPDILSRRAPLPVQHAVDQERFTTGRIYVAPPDHHLLLDADERTRLTRGPKENRARPAVDPLFRSAAVEFGRRVIGVVLSGALDDGTAGLRGIKMCGGTAVVQDPTDALADSMPATALRNVSVDYCRPVRELGPLLGQLVSEAPSRPGGSEDDMRKRIQMELEIAKRGTSGLDVTQLGPPSLFTCPECHGTLLQIRGEKPQRYRCHTGHAFTIDSLLAEQTEATELAIWNAIRSMEESAMLMKHLADHWRSVDPRVADEFVRRAEAEHRRAALLRDAAAEEKVLSEEKIQAEAK